MPDFTKPGESDEETRLQAVTVLRSIKGNERDADPKAWARRLRYRELCGERLSSYQRNAWREALGLTPKDSPE
jgi:hypothetical protein